MTVTLMSIGWSTIKIIFALGTLQHPTWRRVGTSDLGRLKIVSFVDEVGIFFGVYVVALTIIFCVILAVTIFSIEWVTNSAMSVTHASTTAVFYIFTDLKIA